jgi:hypothetical protein
LLELRACLKPDGVLFSSNPHGQNQEGWSDGRYGAYHDLETLAPICIVGGLQRADTLLPSGWFAI